jgi:hypothetical protein
VVRGGDFTGRAGNQAGGISNAFTSTMAAESISVLAENATENYSLGNYNGATLKVAGAAVTARGGENNYALSNEFNVTMEADRVTALAENGSGSNYGMWNVNNAQATVRFGSFTGRGGVNSWGINNHGSGTTLDAQCVTALGDNGSISNYGLMNTSSAIASATQSVLEGALKSVDHDDSGQVTVSNSRLVGSGVSGTVTCVAVSRGNTFNANGCP